ncbi:hypothetical protein PVIIG_04682 [Plasmodium vivax India VII]|uniref:Uncharacterized protein n=1 Tax=Plasmodium vivax India VII TaxID=1077284 RepID=A0A0J9SHX5_PLAVI|nr:hypothetical protein PVIIG_04682 [Plasmodium vivax India VII]
MVVSYHKGCLQICYYYYYYYYYDTQPNSFRIQLRDKQLHNNL